MTVNFQQVRRNVSMQQVLDALGIEVNHRGFGHCPLCGPTSEGSRHKFHVTGKKFFCFRCQEGGNHLDLYAQVKKLSIYDAAKEVSQL